VLLSLALLLGPLPSAASAPAAPASAGGGSSLPPPSLLSRVSRALFPKEASSALSPFAASAALPHLSSLPCFSVTTKYGSPFMVSAGSPRPTALYFLDPEDAESLQQEMLQAPNLPPTQSVHVMATNMERALRHASAPAQPAGGGVGEGGKIDTLDYRIVASSKAREYARSLGSEAEVPVFAVEGLSDRRGRELLFLSPRDCLEACKKQAGKGGGEPAVEVFDLLALARAMEKSPGRFGKVKVVPARAAVEFTDGISRTGNGIARLKPMKGRG
jgi:hypothetical protein